MDDLKIEFVGIEKHYEHGWVATVRVEGNVRGGERFAVSLDLDDLDGPAEEMGKAIRALRAARGEWEE